MKICEKNNNDVISRRQYSFSGNAGLVELLLLLSYVIFYFSVIS